jgi:hypothetical protein
VQARREAQTSPVRPPGRSAAVQARLSPVTVAVQVERQPSPPFVSGIQNSSQPEIIDTTATEAVEFSAPSRQTRPATDVFFAADWAARELAASLRVAAQEVCAPPPRRARLPLSSVVDVVEQTLLDLVRSSHPNPQPIPRIEQPQDADHTPVESAAESSDSDAQRSKQASRISRRSAKSTPLPPSATPYFPGTIVPTCRARSRPRCRPDTRFSSNVDAQADGDHRRLESTASDCAAIPSDRHPANYSARCPLARTSHHRQCDSSRERPTSHSTGPHAGAHCTTHRAARRSGPSPSISLRVRRIQ